MLEGKRILVTGGAGFIGSHLAERLSGSNEVVIFDDMSAGRKSNLAGFEDRVRLYEADIGDEEVLREALAGVNLVFHCAAQVSVEKSVEDPLGTAQTNVGGTLRVLWESKNAGVERVVFPSSAAVYGSSPEIPKREDMEPDADSPYAATKIVGEHFCEMFDKVYDLPTVTLRCFNVYGPRQDEQSPYASVIPRFIVALMDGKSPRIFGDGEQTRDFIFIDDVVEAFILAASSETARGAILNIASGRSMSILELFRTLSGILDVDVEPVFEAERPGDVKHSLADISRAEEKLGFSPAIDPVEGLRRTVGYFKSLR